MREYKVILVNLKDLAQILNEYAQAGWHYADYKSLGNTHVLILER